MSENEEVIKAGDNLIEAMSKADPIRALDGLRMMIRMSDFRDKMKSVKVGELDHADCLRYFIELLDILGVQHE
jgi:aryl carrier-like protein